MKPPGHDHAAKRAIFIDKDGTLIEDLPYNANPARIRLMPQAAESLALLKSCGYLLFVASNQKGIGLGLLTESQLKDGFTRIQQLLEPGSVQIDGFYYCPHHPDQAGCDCRKPSPGLLLQAAREHGLQLQHSWMIGDILDDIEAGHRAGCRSMLINCGNETEWRQGSLRIPDAIAANWHQAASMIASLSARELL